MAESDGGRAVPIRDENRVPWVDYAKGLCIVMVVMMHSTLGVEKATGGTSWLNVAIEFARPFRMPDFFLISGLFLARVIDRDWRTYLDRKLVHFLYFYILWVVIQWALKSIYPAYASGDFASAFYALASAAWDPPGTLWFIYMLPVFFGLTKLLRPVHPALVLGTAAILHVSVRDTGWFVADEFCARFVFFLVGYYAAGSIFRFAAWVEARRVVAIVGLGAWGIANGALVAAGLAVLPAASLGLGLAGALAVITVAVLLSSAGWPSALRYAGQHSLVIYLAFFVPMAAVRTLMLKYGLIPDIGAVSVVVTAIAVTTPLLAHRLCRETRLRFLFERPDWARLGLRPRRSPSVRMVPAE
jgi:uncharacterized membrane protein YcfT